jgi:hypothetical protein
MFISCNDSIVEPVIENPDINIEQYGHDKIQYYFRYKNQSLTQLIIVGPSMEYCIQKMKYIKLNTDEWKLSFTIPPEN